MLEATVPLLLTLLAQGYDDARQAVACADSEPVEARGTCKSFWRRLPNGEVKVLLDSGGTGRAQRHRARGIERRTGVPLTKSSTIAFDG